MPNRNLLFVFLVLVLGFAVTGNAEGEGTATDTPDFSGSWELDAERSDDIEAKLKDAARMASQQRGPGSPRSGRPSTGGWNNSGGRPQGDPDLEKAATDLEHGLRILAIEHEGSEMRISSAMPGSDYAQAIYTDGRAFDRSTLDGSRVPAKAEWGRGGRLVIEYEGLGKRPVRETWEVVADGSRILITTRVAAKGLAPAIELNRVYDRVEIVPWNVPD